MVGFTDSRSKYRPFQVVKYVGDTFPQDYDYYFFSTDYTFINIHRLKDLVNKISVSMDVYMGTPVSDSSYCNIGKYLFTDIKNIHIALIFFKLRCWHYYKQLSAAIYEI